MTKTEWEDWKANNRNDFSALKSLADDEGHDDLFNDLISAQLFPKSEQVDLNEDKGVVKAVKNLLAKMSNHTFVSGIISEYNEIFTKEYSQQ